MRRFVLSVVMTTSMASMAAPHFYSAEELAGRWKGKVHAGEKDRGDDFLTSLKKIGKWLGCASVISTVEAGRPVKLFHQDVIGAAFIRWEQDAERPDFVRYGAFSSEMPETMWGMASFNRGRDAHGANQLIPDVEGLSVFLPWQSRMIPWTTTASRAAFARDGEHFARLAGYSAIGRLILGGYWNSTELRENHFRQLQGEAALYERPGLLRRGLLWSGRLLGEGVFLVGDPAPGFGRLVPATTAAFRSPFTGFKDVGFGTDTRLLSEAPEIPFESRRAFRMSFKLADTAVNRRIEANIPGLVRTVCNAVFGTKHPCAPGTREYAGFHQTAQFYYTLLGLEVGEEITYDVFIQLDDPQNPKLTPIELAHKGWYSDKIRVARMSLVPFPRGRSDLRQDLDFFAEKMHLFPGAGLHLPVGDLAWTRSVGQVMGEQALLQHSLHSRNEVMGAYLKSAALRRAKEEQDQVKQLERLMERFQDARNHP